MKKYIFVTGGVCSSLGKGVTATSIGNLLENRGLGIRMIKIDPYLNVDAGTMSPYQHGEVYVTDDGTEADLDLGNYARFTKAPLSRLNSITTGQIYQEVIKKEREGQYLGRTVQVIPHITDEIKKRIFLASDGEDVNVTIIEVGGTVGDIESIPFLEAARQFIHDLGRENVLFVHLTLIPEVAGGELKTKPTQHSVNKLREIGIQPDILVCRSPEFLEKEMISKISLFTNVEENSIISAYDVKTSVYEIPLIFHAQNLDNLILDKFKLSGSKCDLTEWSDIVEVLKTAEKITTIGIVGKYINLNDSYKSIYESVYHGGIANKTKINLIKIDAEELEKTEDINSIFKEIDGILIPGGFGQRGMNGMEKAAEYARLNNIPCLGICLGMQIMVIEYARNVLELKSANSTEFAPETKYPVISLLEEQRGLRTMGGTMRLGKSKSILVSGTRIHQAYGKTEIWERHRHRYEVSSDYIEELRKSGLIIGGYTLDNNLVESVEWSNHPWSIGVQFHPEFISTPVNPHPLFIDFIKASITYARN
ncbi:MAG: CTP synthase [Spirochaetia bacterium]|jgi:CTP synthase|nr:CTP synthase [Spirochaetia bacterium]